MKAALYQAPRTIEVRDLPVPEPGPGDVVVRVAACGICGTDQHIFEGDFFPTYPVVGGHELAGEVAEVGADVDDIKVGDRVAVDPGVFCGHCFYCQRDQGNHCLNWNGIGITRNGGFAEFALAPRGNVYAIGDLSYEVAAFIEPISCVVYGLRRVQIALGASVLVYGAGPIGLLMSQLARRGGASSVTTVDLRAEKLDLARRLGVEHTIVAGPSADDDLRDLSPLGFDVVIDCTGVPAVVEHMFTHVRAEGKVLFFGVNPADARIQISPYDVYAKDLEIYGSFALRYTFHDAIALLSSGALEVAPLVSHRFAVEDFAEALALAGSGAAMKVQIEPGS